MNHSSFPNDSATKCRERARLLDAYLDGELEPAQLLDVEGHVEGCGGCRERVALDRATRASLKRTLKTGAPEGLRARALAAMQAEKVRGEARLPVPLPSGAWRSIVPLASAAALALAFGSIGRGTPGGGSSDAAVQAGLGAGLGDDLLQELIAEHSSPLPPDRTDREGARQLEQYVGVPVHPAAFERGGARFVGGRVMPVHGAQRAAMLQYVIGTGDKTQRVSVFIYDPSKIQVHSAGLAPRSVGTAEIQVGREKGYSVAVTQNDGVGYAVASDLDAEHSAQLAAFANQD
jgi:anti-sigma factor (TIGR02949 family)